MFGLPFCRQIPLSHYLYVVCKYVHCVQVNLEDCPGTTRQACVALTLNDPNETFKWQIYLSTLSKTLLREFADNNFKRDENGRKFFKRVENTVGKGEIARNEQFLLFPQCFHKSCTADA